jgi:hypothetical protein
MAYTRKVCPCGEKSVPSLIRSAALCQKHFNDLFYASMSSAAHKEAVTMLRKSQENENVWLSKRRDLARDR